MQLFLTSSTITNDLVDDFEEFFNRGISSIKAIFIVDGLYAHQSNLEEKEIRKYIIEDSETLKNNYNWDIDIVRLETSDPVDFSRYELIYVNGGLCGHILKILREFDYENKLCKEIDSGKPYVGSSAGSMIMSKSQDTASWYIGESEPNVIDVEGLGYIDFQIYPHYEEKLLSKIEENIDPKLDYYLLKNGQAVSVKNGQIKTHGGNIKIIHKQK